MLRVANSTHTELVQTNGDALWTFLRDKEEWAKLIPGYLSHEVQAEDAMIWEFKGDFGIVEKAVKVQVNVKEVIENKKIAFDLAGISDNINGEGYFEMEEVEEGKYKVIGNLNMKAGGFLAAMINPVLEKYVPQTIEQHVQAIAQQISQATV